jgi:hypothetical protein
MGTKKAFQRKTHGGLPSMADVSLLDNVLSHIHKILDLISRISTNHRQMLIYRIDELISIIGDYRSALVNDNKDTSDLQTMLIKYDVHARAVTKRLILSISPDEDDLLRISIEKVILLEALTIKDIPEEVKNMVLNELKIIQGYLESISNTGFRGSPDVVELLGKRTMFGG